jgi:LAO/AO transport system kinase
MGKARRALTVARSRFLILRMDASELSERVLAGDTLAAARACRWADDQPAGHRALISALSARATPAYVIGLTGSPGVGKSTLADQLIALFRKRGERVGVVAVDPVSPFSGGALLGDRVRMQRHANDPDVFVRSLSTRGALGGLSRSADATALVLSAWGARVVLLETVGVGQDEIDVCLSADTTLVVAAPGLGDGVQALKAGLLEIADVFVANKADRPGADALVAELEAAVALGVGRADTVAAALGSHADARFQRVVTGAGGAFVPRVVRTNASSGDGVDALEGAIEEHRAWLSTDAGAQRRSARRRERARKLVWSLVNATLEAALSDEIEAELDAVDAGQGDAWSASERLLARLLDRR